VILPFVKDFYAEKHQIDVNFVGHPLLDAIASRKAFNTLEFKEKYNLDDRPIIALLPGSRKQEIKKMLSVMLSMIPRFKAYQFVIGGAPSQETIFYKSIIKNADVAFVPNKTYDLLSIAHVGLVTSGTATLETALFKVPQVVCYKGSWLSYQIAKRIITLKYISLVNLIVDKPLVTELIQGDFNSKRLEKELIHILKEENRKSILNEYDLLIEKLGGGGASKKAAALIIENSTKPA